MDGQNRQRVVVITGVSSGIGLAAAKALATRGLHVVGVARDRTRGENAVAAVRAAAPGAAVELRVGDLASLASVRALAAELLAAHPRIDVLVNNAGAVFDAYGKTEDGIERTIAINHVGPALLTELLLPALKAAAPSRIVNVSSVIQSRGRLDPSDLGFERRGWSTYRSYGASKLANVVATIDLAERLAGSGVTVNAIHPGLINTNIGGDTRGLIGAVMKLWKKFATTPENGAGAVVHATLAPELEGVTGKYFERNRVVRPNRQATDPALRKAFAEETARLIGQRRDV